MTWPRWPPPSPSRTRLIFVCNPNNPTGTVVHGAELDRFLDRVPADCLVVLDEAYHEYVRDPDVPDGISLYPTGRTWPCCGPSPRPTGWPRCGSGYLVGARAGRRGGAQDAAAVRRERRRAGRRHRLAGRRGRAAGAGRRGRRRSAAGSRDELLDQGWTVPPTEANFVWLPLGDDTADFAAACEQAGRHRPAVRRPTASGSPSATPAANDDFLRAGAGAGRAAADDRIVPGIGPGSRYAVLAVRRRSAGEGLRDPREP